MNIPGYDDWVLRGPDEPCDCRPFHTCEACEQAREHAEGLADFQRDLEDDR